MTGNPWYSTECCAVRTLSYAQTFQDAIIRMHKSFAGGINKLVYHVYSYRDSDSSRWPATTTSAGRVLQRLGSARALLVDARAYNDYIARNQQVLTQGDAKTDVAVYMQNYLYPEPWSNPGGFRI